MSPDPDTNPESEDPSEEIKAEHTSGSAPYDSPDSDVKRALFPNKDRSGTTSAPEEDAPEPVPSADDVMAMVTSAANLIKDAGAALGLPTPPKPERVPVILNQPKAGIGTTEFWLTLVFAIVVVIAAADTATGAIAGAIAVAAYALSRGAVKIPAEWDKYKNIRFNSISAKLEELKQDGLDLNAVVDAVADDLESMSDAKPSTPEEVEAEASEDEDDDVDPDEDTEPQDGEDPDEDTEAQDGDTD